MNLVLDENLSPRLVPRLASLFPGLKHVREISLKQSADAEIWNWAKVFGHTIVTTNFDFVLLSKTLG